MTFTQPKGFLINSFNRLWHSPTFTTWGSLAARMLSLSVVLPLILHKFPVGDISLWLLFSTIISLQLIADMGFSQTFTRAIAYAMAGARPDELKDLRINPEKRDNTHPNWDTVRAIVATMHSIYRRLMVGFFILMLPIGTLALIRPIAESSNSEAGWLAWAVVMLSTALTLWGNGYVSFLMGTENISLLRRWEIISALAAIGTSLLVLVLGGGVPALVIANQGWVIFAVIRNRWLCRKIVPADVWAGQDGQNRAVLDAVWPSAWRSGVGVMMSYGIIQASGIIYAQIGNGVQIASYLLGLRLIQIVSQFSQAPFYSKIPSLSRFRSRGDLTQQVTLATQGMRAAHWTFALGFVMVGVLTPLLLALIGSKTPFVSHDMWLLLGAAFFFERMGAMHLQLYSVTNHIIWHIANGWTGLAMLSMGFLMYKQLGVSAFPIAMLVSHISIYCTVSMVHSYRSFALSFPRYESKVAVPAMLFVLFSEVALRISAFVRFC